MSSKLDSLSSAGGLAVVTGGTGFIGQHLVSALLQAGRRVRLVVRRNSPNAPRFLAPPSPGSKSQATRGTWETVWGDIRDAGAVEGALEGAGSVFHLAARARAWASDPKEFDTINREGTRNVLRGAARHGVRRVVHVSTELADEAFPAVTAYQRSKRAAEELVREYVARGGDAVIVRPTRVYGPGPMNQSNAVTRVIALDRRGLFRVRLADHGARANYVFVRDLVDGLVAAEARGIGGTAYLLGGENLTFEQLLDLIAEATGRARRHAVLALPTPLALMVAYLCELGALAGLEPLITRDWVKVLAEDRPMSSKRAQAELGYAPRSAREGIAATVAWLAAGSPAPSLLSPARQSA